MGIITILWEKWVEFRRDFYKITLAAMIAPLMYLVVFGMGIQTISHGEPYLNFLIPGVVSLTTMNGSFNAIAQNLNVQRLYEKAFDQVLISPTPLWQFIAGQIIGGSLRGFYAGGVILVLTMPIDTGLIFNGWSFLVMFLNGAVFSAIGVVVSFLAKNHADVPRFSNYIIMPMAYLCNTFFSTEKLPGFLGKFVSALPLSQTSHMIRSISAGEGFALSGIVILLVTYLTFLQGSHHGLSIRKRICNCSVPLQLRVKMHSRSPSVIAFCLVCLGILAKNMPKHLAGYYLLNSYKNL